MEGVYSLLGHVVFLSCYMFLWFLTTLDKAFGKLIAEIMGFQFDYKYAGEGHGTLVDSATKKPNQFSTKDIWQNTHQR